MTVANNLKRLIKSATGGLPFTVDESWIVFDAFGKKPGVMVDVGANIGESLKPFVEAAWTVHAFEPDPANYAILQRAFGANSRVSLVEKALSSEAGQFPLFTSSESIGISSLTPFTDHHSQTAVVEVVTLTEYSREMGVSHIDFLKIDVEGFEMNVLRGFDWSDLPDTIVLEFEDSKTKPLGYLWTDLGDLLVAHGYSVVISEWAPIARYGTEHTWLRFVDYPSKLLNEDGWGNLIATRLDRKRLNRALRRSRRRYRIRRTFSRVRRKAESDMNPPDFPGERFH